MGSAGFRESNFLHRSLHASWIIMRAQVSFMLRRAEPGSLNTTLSNINDICASNVSSARIKAYESYNVNPQTMIFLTKLVMQITLFE